VKGCASDLKRGRCGVVRRENTSTQWSELKWFLDDDSGVLSADQSVLLRQSHVPSVCGSDELLRRALAFRRRCRSFLGLPFLPRGSRCISVTQGFPLGTSARKIWAVRRSIRWAYIQCSTLTRHIVSLPLPRRFGLALDTLNESIDVVRSPVYLFPFKFIGIGCCASITASTANEDFSTILG